MKSYLIVGVLALLMGSQAWSACREASVPNLPNPEFADFNEMLEAQVAVRQYIQQQQQFLDCSRDGIRHNRAVDHMYNVAKEFNKITRRFKARERSQDIFTELALISY